MNENSPICARLAETVTAVANGKRKKQHDRKGSERLSDDDQQDRQQNMQRLAPQDRRIEQHADRDEEQHGERILKRQ